MFRFAAALLALLASCIAAPGAETFMGPDGKPVNQTKCRISVKGCYDEAYETCHGPYQIIDGDTHTGGLLADFWAGRVIWYTIIYRCNARPTPQSSPSPGEQTKPQPLQETKKSDETGSGFLISSDGLLLTNAHVAGQCNSVFVTGVGRATLIAQDPVNDIALIKASIGPASKPLSLSSRNLRLGEDIVVLGFPLSGVLSGLNATAGNVSALAGIGNNTTYIQFTAPIQPGNSGGPVLDRAGGVAGIASAKLNWRTTLNRSGAMPENVNFAVKKEAIVGFLSTQGIHLQETPSSPDLSVADIAEAAKASVFRIECVNSTANASIPASSSPPDPGRASGHAALRERAEPSVKPQAAGQTICSQTGCRPVRNGCRIATSKGLGTGGAMIGAQVEVCD